MSIINDKKLLEEFNQFKSRKTHQKELSSFIAFCTNCKDNIDTIPSNNPAFISKGINPVAGIGYGTSELTIECQEKLTKNWAGVVVPLLNNINHSVDEKTVSSFSDLVRTYRGHTLNLFVNRCIITLHYTELLAIANKADLKVLFNLLGEDDNYQSFENQNIEWYNNNIKIFSILKTKLSLKDTTQDLAELSMFGWYLRERLLQVSSLKKTLENCYNIVFTGAPGTGKTYSAKDLASVMDAEWEFTQFHPSYDYTDFVEGLRPDKATSPVSFSRQDGIFKRFCRRAVQSIINNEDKKFIMIIDEINRGEISKIFGELFFSIDPGYRVKKADVKTIISATDYNAVKKFVIKTQYQNLIEDSDQEFRFGFFVPENVYIIGTMNDIDRSVESMDFAMRRRFTFIDFIAKEHLGMLDIIDDYDTRILARAKMEALNSALVDPKVGGLSVSYQIGGSYFINVNSYKDSDNQWDSLWEYHLKGLLYEYFRGMPDADEKLKSLKDVYDKAKS